MNEFKLITAFGLGMFVVLVLLVLHTIDERYREARHPAPAVQPCGPDRPCPCPGPKCPAPRKGDLGDVIDKK